MTASGGATTSGGSTVMGGSTATSGGSIATSGGSTATSGGSTATGGSTAAGGSTGSGGSTGPLPSDAKALVKSFPNPGSGLDEKLNAYVDTEIGKMKIGTEGTGSAREITETIVVPPGVIYDGKGEKLTAVDMGYGSQAENQKPYFILTPGVPQVQGPDADLGRGHKARDHPSDSQ